MVGKILRFVLFFSFFFSVILRPAYAEDPQKSSSAILEATSSAAPDILYDHYDHRVETLKRFLEKYNSDFAQNAQVFVDEADKNNLDWKLLVAISGVESTFGQAVPPNCNNAWGYNIYGDHRRCFDSYAEAIKTISYDIRHLYMDTWGATDVYSIGGMYAASPTWAQRVVANMQSIQDFADKTASPTLPISL